MMEFISNSGAGNLGHLPFEGPTTVKPPALPEDSYLLGETRPEGFPNTALETGKRLCSSMYPSLSDFAFFPHGETMPGQNKSILVTDLEMQNSQNPNCTEIRAPQKPRNPGHQWLRRTGRSQEDPSGEASG